jgi:hypothetical protein
VKQAGTPVESLARSLFQVMLHFCRARFRGVLRPRAGVRRSEARFSTGKPSNVEVPARTHYSDPPLLFPPDPAAGVPLLFAILGRVREFPAVRPRQMLGYRRPFATIAEATAAIAGSEDGGHTDPQIGTVFDLGGGIGNISYCFSNIRRYQTTPAGSSLTCPRQAGPAQNAPRDATNLGCSAAEWGEAEGVDLLITTAASLFREVAAGGTDGSSTSLASA